MNPAVAGAIGGTIIGGCVPFVLRQIRNGAVQIGHIGVRPIVIRRNEHPRAFVIATIGLTAVIGVLLATCAVMIVGGAFS